MGSEKGTLSADLPHSPPPRPNLHEQTWTRHTGHQHQHPRHSQHSARGSGRLPAQPQGSPGRAGGSEWRHGQIRQRGWDRLRDTGLRWPRAAGSTNLPRRRQRGQVERWEVTGRRLHPGAQSVPTRRRKGATGPPGRGIPCRGHREASPPSLPF